MKVKCPNCEKLTDLEPSNPWRPFCSERCKLMDMGDWISERHHIPGEPVESTQQDSEEPESWN